MKKRIYISGKISETSYNDDIANFVQADIELSNIFEVVPSSRYCLPIMTAGERMREGLKHLIGCHAIYMLSNWKESKQARLEHFVALHLGMEIIKQK